MPFVPRLFVKTGIVYLVLTFVVGAVLLTLEALGRSVPFIVGVEHAHMGFVGWLVNTVIGVALWLLPINRKAFPQTQGRYPETPARLAFVLLNAGLAVRLIGEPLQQNHPTAAVGALVVAAAFAQVASIAIVGWIVWQRVYAPPMRPNA